MSTKIFCCFDQLHYWNSRLCPPIGFITNFGLVWLIIKKTPKEMKIHSRILLQTCVIDIALLFVTLFGQPVLSFQPDGSCVMLWQGYFSWFFKEMPLANLCIFAIWYFLTTIDVNGIAIQFIYRFLGLNCLMNINLLRYFYIAILPFATALSLSITWFLLIAKDQLNSKNLDVSYFSTYMDQQAAQAYSFVTYSFNSNYFVTIWNYSFQVIQLICYIIVVFCGFKMVRFVYVHSILTPKMKELNKQLIKTLIILATFPIILLSTNLFIVNIAPYIFNLSTESLLFMFECLLNHWLPILNPIASIYTIRPYREELMYKLFGIKRSFTNVTPITIHVQKLSKKGISAIKI